MIERKPNGWSVSVIDHGHGVQGAPYEVALIDPSNRIVAVEGWLTFAHVDRVLDTVRDFPAEIDRSTAWKYVLESVKEVTDEFASLRDRIEASRPAGFTSNVTGE